MESQTLTFAEATTGQISAIVDIHNANVLDQSDPHSEGFLLTQVSEKDVLNHLNSSGRYFVALDEQNTVLGFLSISRPHISDQFLNEIAWIDPAFKQDILSERHRYLNVVAVKPGCRGRGIAQLMYTSLYEELRDACLSAFIVTKPVLNRRSVTFHEKQGFKTIGVLQKDQFLNFKHYESILVFKDLR